MSDFKQQVEEIQCKSRSCGECMEHCPIFPCDPVRDASNAILAAHDRELERIAKSTHIAIVVGGIEDDGSVSQAIMHVAGKCPACQAYIQAQKGS